MIVIAHNHGLEIDDPSPEEKRNIIDMLSYTDKSKQYQAKRLKRSSWASQKAIEDATIASYGCLLETSPTGKYLVPPGFSDKFTIDIDNRKDTGSTISLPWVKQPPDLRPYQDEAVSAMMSVFRGTVNMATGLGKTLTTVHFIRRLKRKTLVVCPSSAIANGFYKELVSAFGESKVGFIGGGKKKIKDITVGLVQSIVNSLDSLVKEDLGAIIFDETHHLAASTFYKVAQALGGVGRMYGLTATAFRSDGKDIFLRAGVGDTIIKRDAKWGIANGWLAHPVFVMREVMTYGTDYKDDKLKNYKKHVLTSKEMNEIMREDISKCLSKGKSTLVLVSEIEHGKALSEATGIPFATDDSLVEKLNDGEISGLIATASLVGEGCDTKRVDALILANFAGSAGPCLQNIGRGLRKYPGKESVLIVDYSPMGSTMLTRHAKKRLSIFKSLSDDVHYIKYESGVKTRT